ncbi:MAG: NAD-dependent epimerase/dehydratase family protein [Actinomycetota bacterium]
MSDTTSVPADADPDDRANAAGAGGASPVPRCLYITGATGFVGSAVVRVAVARGHRVVAVTRPGSTATALRAEGSDGLRLARVDLRSTDGLAESLTGVDTVIHLAAAKAGTFATQFAGTVVATENLLGAMERAGVDRLVGISTFSVYDYRNLSPGTVIDEDAPIDLEPTRRDEYAKTKLVQERLYRDFTGGDRRHVIVRPGMIYGADNLWHALLGTELGPAYVRIGSRAVLPMTYVENCAEAIVLAAERLGDATSPVAGEVINVVDDDLPTQQAYADAVASRTEVPSNVTVPWALVRAGAETLAVANRRLLGGRAKFPGIAVPERLHARFKPLRYTNAKAKRLLGWSPRYGLSEAIERSLAAEADRAAAATSDNEDRDADREGDGHDEASVGQPGARRVGP